ncbi:hypothetical protein [Helicobacter suis]|uniref:hypothetical protein n=1 Tax=Helicobacter suis TaxID=104628 RepID=UPI0013D6329B|nr:hypothetical protein [Helicobacter suis]
MVLKGINLFDVMARTAQMEKLPNVYTCKIGYLAHADKETTKVQALADLHVKKVKEILETGKTAG